MAAVNPLSPPQLAEWLQSAQEFWLVDVREPYEWRLADLPSERMLRLPLSALSAQGTAALPEAILHQNTPLVVLCHAGERSRMVAAWLAANGWDQVYDLTGGLDAYARLVDPAIGRY
jgi:rhodanese-related sulfurtransferase